MLAHAGSSPVIRTKNDDISLSGIIFRGVAQLVARLVRDQEVVGSNPVTPTNKNGSKLLPFFYVLKWIEIEFFAFTFYKLWL